MNICGVLFINFILCCVSSIFVVSVVLLLLALEEEEELLLLILLNDAVGVVPGVGKIFLKVVNECDLERLPEALVN